MMGWQALRGFIRKEFRQSLRDPVMQRLIFLAPILQMLVFGFALDNQSKNIKMAVFSKPEDVVIGRFVDKALASGWFAEVDRTAKDPFQVIQSGRAEVALIVKDAKLGDATELSPVPVQILISAVNVLRAQAMESYVQAILSETLGLTQLQRGLVSLETRILYNPRMETSYFLIPGLIGIIICLITVLLTSMAFAREREVGTMEMILSAPISKWEIILGKAIPSVILAGINSFMTCSVGAIVFGMPFVGSLALMSLVILAFIITTVAIGIAISTISETQQQAMMGSFLFLFPALLLSGLMFPVENMPAFMKIFAEINPITHFNYIMRNIILKGGDVEFIFIHTGIIVLIGAAATVVAFKNFKTTLN
ncbi:MAG: ABC transporter permease [Bdellovibrionales bacterium]|nr:ABC transporter permease [Bdellovibrionales bacterium]